MSTRVAVVTGANRGLGLQTCRELGQRGYRVVLTGRDRAKAEAAAQQLRDEGLDVTAAQLDVASDDSVQAFAATIDRVDVLVNNAGAIFEDDVPAAEVPASMVREAIDTNALGAYRLTQALLPKMNAAGYGRVVNVSSGMGALNEMGGGWPAYRISKTTLNAVTQVFANQAGRGVKVVSVCPGWVRTDMGGTSANRSIPEGAASIVTAATLPDDGPSGVFLRDGRVIDW